MEYSDIELALKDRLEAKGKSDLWAGFVAAKNHVYSNILPHIARVEPFLTDHGEKHVDNVFENSSKLLGNEFSSLNCRDHYILCLAILFHDVGNIRGRDGHEKKISECYDAARGCHMSLRQEKSILTQVVASHSGVSPAGTKDTIEYLSDRPYNGGKVRLQNIAAILKFADELAEGDQRTSEDLLRCGGVPSKAALYHIYALNTAVTIDCAGGRVGLDFNINVGKGDAKVVVSPSTYNIGFDKFMNFAEDRIVKLNTERLYTKYYSDDLKRYREVSVSMRFWKKTSGNGNKEIDDIKQEYTINDKVVPGDIDRDGHFKRYGLSVHKMREDIKKLL